MKTLKVVLVGDGGVGKTTYVRRLSPYKGQRQTLAPFEPKYVATLGVEVHPVDYAGVRLNMWDTAGQEKFGGLRDGYYVQAECGMVCFDLTSKLSFKNAMGWAESLARYTTKLVLIGFKSDLQARVSQEEIHAFTAATGIPYFALSTKVASNLNAPLAYLAGLANA